MYSAPYPLATQPLLRCAFIKFADIPPNIYIYNTYTHTHKKKWVFLVMCMLIVWAVAAYLNRHFFFTTHRGTNKRIWPRVFLLCVWIWMQAFWSQSSNTCPFSFPFSFPLSFANGTKWYSRLKVHGSAQRWLRQNMKFSRIQVSDRPIWRCPKVGVPLNHEFLWDFPGNNPSNTRLGIPHDLGKSHIFWGWPPIRGLRSWGTRRPGFN